jgi:hypothetical protein
MSSLEEQPPAPPAPPPPVAPRGRLSRRGRRAIPAPAADPTSRRAADEICARLCRDLLGDFAPALLLLSRTERPRVQALTAYARSLFDIAREPGPEGERLERIGRSELTLEFALLGEPVEQPVLVAMAGQNARQPWPPGALEELAAAARRRALRARPADPLVSDEANVADVANIADEADEEAQRLAAAFVQALLGAPPAGEVGGFAGTLVRLHALQNLGAEGAAHRECARLRGRLLRAPRALVEIPPRYRRAAVFALLAGVRLLSLIEDGDGLLTAPPRLGLASRLALLAQAHWFRIG